MILRAALGLTLLLLTCSASAHPLKPGLLRVTPIDEVSESYEVSLKLPAAGRISAKVEVDFPRLCTQVGQTRVSRFEGALVETWRLQCAPGGLASEATHFEGLSRKVGEVLVLYPDSNGGEHSARVAADSPSITLAPEADLTLSAYFLLGVEHILLGIDHLLFVLGLMMLIASHSGHRQRITTLFWTISAFTLAHSLTLGAATLGFVALPSDAVETVIAMSIVLLALELARSDGARTSWTRSHPASIAFLFGLLHGFGFAGALSDLGLPSEGIVSALLLFNVGVEFGQLAFVACAGLIAWLGRGVSLKTRHAVRAGLINLLGGLAVYWTLDRGAALVLRWLNA